VQHMAGERHAADNAFKSWSRSVVCKNKKMGDERENDLWGSCADHMEIEEGTILFGASKSRRWTLET
jgi:hypothetical protein